MRGHGQRGRQGPVFDVPDALVAHERTSVDGEWTQSRHQVRSRDEAQAAPAHRPFHPCDVAALDVRVDVDAEAGREGVIDLVLDDDRAEALEPARLEGAHDLPSVQ